MATTNAEQPVTGKLPVNNLDFDKENPRFPTEIGKSSEKILIERFIRDERLLEIVQSIADQGFFPGEPLLVVKNGRRYTVVEGNRRLAALKLLNKIIEPPQGRIAIERVIQEAQHRPSEVQCLIFKQAASIVRYLGFRHITGIKPWNALQKARYMQRLLEDSHGNLSKAQGLRALARETGSSSAYLGQSITALGLYKIAESKGFFGLKLSPDDVEFSLLTTALSYSNINGYIGVSDPTAGDDESINETSLANLFKWLFVAQSNQHPIVRESRQLKKLAAVVAEPEALADLVKSGNLDDAFELSKGTAQALTESLGYVRRRLDKAWTWLPKVSASNLNDEHEEESATAAEIATDLHEAIASKRKGPRNRRTPRNA
jgi:hypothetical protein